MNETSEKSSRETLGLDRANAGDIAGLVAFLNFTQRELYGLAYLTDFPQPMKDRIAETQKQVKETYDFAVGFSQGWSHVRENP